MDFKLKAQTPKEYRKTITDLCFREKRKAELMNNKKKKEEKQVVKERINADQDAEMKNRQKEIDKCSNQEIPQELSIETAKTMSDDEYLEENHITTYEECKNYEEKSDNQWSFQEKTSRNKR